MIAVTFMGYSKNYGLEVLKSYSLKQSIKGVKVNGSRPTYALIHELNKECRDYSEADKEAMVSSIFKSVSKALHPIDSTIEISTRELAKYLLGQDIAIIDKHKRISIREEN